MIASYPLRPAGGEGGGPAPPIAELRYLGHAVRNGTICSMRGSVEQVADSPLETPVVPIIGTSMDAAFLHEQAEALAA